MAQKSAFTELYANDTCQMTARQIIHTVTLYSPREQFDLLDSSEKESCKKEMKDG